MSAPLTSQVLDGDVFEALLPINEEMTPPLVFRGLIPDLE
jgi:hypothetical protein